MRFLRFFIFLLAFSIFSACDSGPKVIESAPASTDNATSSGSSVLDEIAAAQQQTPSENQMHKVVVQEALNTDKYTYMNVTENGENFWIAASKMPVEKGETLYYSGGLMKKNFQSREFNRVFETLYLVSNIQKQPTAGGSAVDQALAQAQDGGSPSLDPPKDVKLAEGAIKISELLANKQKYVGKMVKITGKCMKINPNIMGRNWIHLQDGSANNYDLTVTTTENIPLGHTVTLEGTVALDKDFGAGYRYDIIVEGAVLR
ncbi:MAG: hypothetical protein H6577_25460 [Lewinellaceae bacterium]|nr:hypothetical protein [Saprospiraceae bacterium]MCB9341484.1 hypothetical protein [Lewinellaceae bacterium]